MRRQQLVIDGAFLGVGFPTKELEECFDINIVLLT